MLSACPVQPTIPVADMERAIAWYRDRLGLSPAERRGPGALYRLAGGSGFLLYQTPNAGKAPNTLMEFETPDIAAEMTELRGRGVVFEEYDFPGLKTVDGVATIGDDRAAWFKDSEGNILALSQALTPG